VNKKLETPSLLQSQRLDWRTGLNMYAMYIATNLSAGNISSDGIFGFGLWDLVGLAETGAYSQHFYISSHNRNQRSEHLP
jgi:hypothetical protein